MKTGNAPRHFIKRPQSLVLIGVFMLVAAAVAVPLYSVRSSSLPHGSASIIGLRSSQIASHSELESMVRGSRSPFARSILPVPQSSPEEISTFASDCTTPKSSFILGETVCAKTVFVTETDRFVNWIDPNSNIAYGGPTTTPITNNTAQDFRYTPTIVGAWKVTIADPSDSSIVPANFTVVPPPPLATYDSTCTISRTTFLLGETVCAKSTGITPGFARRFTWSDPAGFIRQTDSLTTDPQTDLFTLPSSQTSMEGNTTVDNRGGWKVNVISSRGSTLASAPFFVSAATPSADLSIIKGVGSSSVRSGDHVSFILSVSNSGPNDAVNVTVTDATPANATFFSAMQTSGPTPAFSCTGNTTVTCTVAALAAGDRAILEFVYTAGTPGSTITNTATVSSDTTEVNSSDNSSTAQVTVEGSGGGTCTLTCPGDITTPANTKEDPNDPNSRDGAVVHFTPPSGQGTCGNITTDHCNDCFFPVGTTTITATADSGDACSFDVTVTQAGAPAISCPADTTANADNDCQATVAVGTATASGNNVTVIGTRSDGQPMYDCDANGNCTRRSSDAPFPAGTTTITWHAYSHDIAGPYTTPGPNAGDTFEEQHRTGGASCTQTITVNDVTPPTIGATDQTISADANCQAAVPNYSSTVTDNCACASSDTSEACAGHPHITYTQDPAPGTIVGPGQYPVHITANDGSSNNDGAGNTSQKTITLTVADTTPPTIHCPANMSTNTLPGTCSAVVVVGTATATDNCDINPSITGTRSDNQPLIAPYPKGTTTITWTATDSSGNHSSCTQTVTVVDNEPPVITFNGQTPSMWPPNHSYHTFTAADFISSVSDNCDTLSISDVDIISATSDEVENSNGSGNTLNDIVIASNCKSIQLRAERENSGNGRVYTITFRLRDRSGNTTTGTAKVYSPKNEGEIPPDDGPHYTVTGSCP